MAICMASALPRQGTYAAMSYHEHVHYAAPLMQRVLNLPMQEMPLNNKM